MPIATLTTDFGTADPYAAMLKGALLSAHPGLQLVDITHNVCPYDIVQAAYILKNTWQRFPAGTVHLISVGHFSKGVCPLIVFQKGDHYFTGPDNGLFSLLFDEMPASVVQLPQPGPGTLDFLDVMAKAAAALTEGAALETRGEPLEAIDQRLQLQPVITASQIRGGVIHVDQYENVVINISRELFEQVAQGRKFALYFKRHDPITQVSTHYGDVPVGEVLCLFNAAGYLEIAINMGKAAGLLGLRRDDVVQVDFF